MEELWTSYREFRDCKIETVRNREFNCNSEFKFKNAFLEMFSMKRVDVKNYFKIMTFKVEGAETISNLK